MSILNIAIQISLYAVLFSMGCCIWRLIMGPSMVDRLLALDTLFLNGVCTLIILGIAWISSDLFEVALLLAMLGFISTAALARYFTSAMVID